MAADQPPQRILWIKSGPLHPLDTGGKKRTYNMVRELNAQHEVTFLALRPEGTTAEITAAAAEYSTHQIWIDWREPSLALGLARNFLFSKLPYVLKKYHHQPLADKILELDASGEFDLIVCDFLTPAVNLPPAGELKTPTVLFQHNMEAQIWQRLAAGKRNPLSRFYFSRQYARMQRWEARLSRYCDGVITVSEQDSAYARDNYGLENVLGAVPTGVDFEYFEPSKEPGGGETPVVGFLGSMDWMPNIEAAHFFVERVYPELKQRLEGVRFVIIGRNPPTSVRALATADSSIEVTGTVDDVREYLARCDVLAVPLLSGGGTRIKIMESVAAGLPAVSTAVGAEGLDLEDRQEILIADEPKEFASALAELCKDPDRRRAIAAAALVAARRTGSWQRVTGIFYDHCRKVMRG